MMRKQRFFVVVSLILGALLLLGGCGAARNNSGSGEAVNPAKPAASAPAYTGTSGNETADRDGKASYGSMELESGQKIIYTHQVGLSVVSPKEASDALQEEARRTGGYVEAAELYQVSEDRMGARLTLRVPADKGEAFTSFYQQQGDVTRASVNSQNVTDEYTDLETWLAHEKAQEAQLIELMKKAQNIEETLKVREVLGGVQRNIETYEGRKAHIDKAVSYTSFSFELTQRVSSVAGGGSSVVQGSLWDNIGNAFTQSIRFLGDVGSVLLIVLSFIALPALIAGTVVFVIVRLAKRRRAVRSGKAMMEIPVPPYAQPPTQDGTSQ